MACAIMPLSLAIWVSINCSRSSCNASISRCRGCALPVKASTSCSSVHCNRLSPNWASCLGSVSPAAKARRMRSPLAPSRSLTTMDSLIRISSNKHSIWFCSRTRSRVSCSFIRVMLRQLRCSPPGTKLKIIVVSDLLGASGLRILRALAAGETDAKQLAQLGDKRLQCTEEQLVDALTGSAQPLHREMLALQLERLQLIDTQIAKLNGMIAQAMKPHQEAVMRLAEVPGLGVDSAQQIIAEVGEQASTFPSAAELN